MTNVSEVEKMAELMLQMEENSPRVAALQYCLKQVAGKVGEAEKRNAELEARCAALAAENAGLKNQLRELFNSCDTGERRGNGSLSGAAVPDWCVLEKTRQFLESAPATDAFMAEVRASAVDEACLKISNAIVNCYQDEQIGLDAAATICGDFASGLRKGVLS